jgi:hypothetical protein
MNSNVGELNAGILIFVKGIKMLLSHKNPLAVALCV